MNLITNRCLGAFIYRDILHIPYNNVFMWTGISCLDFNTLFEDYDFIDFNKTSIDAINRKEYKGFYLIIDGKVRVNYSHVLYDKSAQVPIVRGTNIYYNKPWKYIVEKYSERLKRMVEPPTFIYMDLDFNKDYVIADIARKIHKQLIVITVDRDFPTNEYLSVLYVDKQDWCKVDWWDYLKDNYENDIKRLLGI